MILTLTVNPALDIYTRVDRIESDHKLRCEAPSRDPGGGGVNVSRVIKRLGGTSRALYTKGGYTGELFCHLLKEEEVEQDPIEVKQDLRQNFAVTENSTGELYRFGMPGGELEEEEYEKILKKIVEYKEADFLVASGSLPPGAPKDFYARVAKKAKENDIKLILDTSGAAFQPVLEEGVFLVKPNMNELKDLFGREANSEEEQKDLLLEVLKRYNVEVIVASLGASGAFLATNNTVSHYPAPRVEHVSSIGAGDSMVAGISFALASGKSLKESVFMGLACGSATIKSPGTELLKREDAEQLYEMLCKNDRCK